MTEIVDKHQVETRHLPIKRTTLSKSSTITTSIAATAAATQQTTDENNERIYPTWHNFVAGGVAGLCSRMVTAPLDLIRIRRQLNYRTNHVVSYPLHESIWTSWQSIVTNEGGISALYRGNMSAIYLWITYSAVQFSIYGTTKEQLQVIVPELVTLTTTTTNSSSSSATSTTCGTKNRIINNIHTTNIIVSFCSGAIAGLCATIITYPFDVCRTTFSAYGLTTTTATIHTAGTTTGMAPTMITADAGAALTQKRTILQIPFQVISSSPPPPPLDTVRMPQPPLPLSSLYEPPLFPSSTTTTTTTLAPSTMAKPLHSPLPSPLSVLKQTPLSPKQQQQQQLPRTLMQFVQQMYQLQGIRGFYAGVTPALIQIIPYMGCNFAIYDYLTTTTNNNSNNNGEGVGGRTSIGLSAYAGSVSGAISKMIVYPLDTVKRRLQAQAFFTSSHVWSSNSRNHHHVDGNHTQHLGMDPNHHPSSNRHKHYTGMSDCIISIHKNEGWRSFYRGIVPSVMKTAISTSLTFACFRWTQTTLHWTHDRLHHSL